MSPSGRAARIERHRDSFGKCLRVVVMGPSQVGKTSIISRFIHDTYNDNYVETIEDLHHRNNFPLDDSERVDVEVLDTSGALSFPAMRRLAIASADVVLLVFSVEDLESFERCAEIRQEVTLSRPDLPILFVANRIDCDLTGRLLARDTIELSVDIEWNHGYVEVSAKTGQNIQEAFRQACSRSRKAHS